MKSFIEVGPGKQVFVGVYNRVRVTERPMDEILPDPEIQYLAESFGMGMGFAVAKRESFPWFQFELTDVLLDKAGRLAIARPNGRNIVRLAENLDVPIEAIEASPLFDPPPPGWRELMLTGPEVRHLPTAWAARLREWRGIYLIVDESDGQRYVGAVYGEENLLGRWTTHVAGDRGVTRELRQRNPLDFRFSILERVSPDMLADDVIALEQTWMERLHTRQFGLNA